MVLWQPENRRATKWKKYSPRRPEVATVWTNTSSVGWVLLGGVWSVCLSEHPHCVHLSAADLRCRVIDAAMRACALSEEMWF